MVKRLLLLVCGVAGIAFALSRTGSSTGATVEIHVGDISGTHGSEGGDASSTAAERKYGFHCAGKTCAGDDTPPSCDNTLTVTLVRGEGETEALLLSAKTRMHNKESKLTSKDWDCPIGPPKWDAQASIKLSNAGAGGPGSNATGGGSISDSFQHTTSPTTSWAKVWTQHPTPSGTNGTTYASEISPLEHWPWEYDEQNPSTNSFVVTAKVVTDFQGSAVEIDVVECYLRATCTLEVWLTP